MRQARGGTRLGSRACGARRRAISVRAPAAPAGVGRATTPLGSRGRAGRLNPLDERIRRRAVVRVLERRGGAIGIDPRLTRMGLEQRIVGDAIDRRVLDRASPPVDAPHCGPAGTAGWIVLLHCAREFHLVRLIPAPSVQKPAGTANSSHVLWPVIRAGPWVRVNLVRCRYKLEI